MASENRGQHSGGKSERGFASMDRQRQREIASQGGRAAHEKGTAHEFDSEEARRAGQRGGEAVSRDRQHMAEIGRKGGESRGNRGAPDGGAQARRAAAARRAKDQSRADGARAASPGDEDEDEREESGQ